MIEKIQNVLIKNNLNFNILNIYPYGSINYGTYNDKSDRDYIIITTQTIPETDTIIYNDINITSYSYERFYNKLILHDISILESVFLADDSKIETIKIKNPKINLTNLRTSISKISSNSWVKCKKKIEVENENYIGYKSLFHSLRILDYGIQISNENRLIDYKRPYFLKDYEFWSDLLNEIVNISDWMKLKNKYKTDFNHLKSEFRKKCPLI